MKIGIFDSGVGGLSVLEKILRHNPKVDILYLADKKNCPYGEKIAEELIKIVKENIKYLIDNSCDTVIIACNTASYIYHMYLKDEFDIKVYNILEFSMKWICEKNIKDISVFETEFLAKEKRFNEMFKSVSDDNINILEISGKDIAKKVESNKMYFEDIKDAVKAVPKDMDKALLSCTHYSLVYEDFKKLKEKVKRNDLNLLDPTLKFSEYVLKDLNIDTFNNDDINYEIKFCVNKNEEEFKSIFKKVFPCIKI